MWRGRVTKVLFQVMSSETMVMKVRDVEGKSNHEDDQSGDQQ